jgi:hypothetical protein
MDQIDRELEEICKDHSTENFYKEQGLEKFYKNYQRKSLTNYLSKYLQMSRLKDYRLLHNKNKTKLVPKKTYIKYISIDDAYIDKYYDDHIKAGGILIDCGKLIGDKFVSMDDPSEWYCLMLKFDPSVIINKKGQVVRDRLEPRVFFINLSKHYVFFRRFENGFRDLMHRMMEKIEVELIDENGRIV